MDVQAKCGIVAVYAAFIWSVVVCSKEPCSRPGKIDGAKINRGLDPDVDTVDHGTVVYYKCEGGRDFQGYYNNRTCVNGQWSDPDFRCDWQLCPHIQTPRHGRRINKNSIPAEYTRFECNPGYILKGPKRMLCRVGGTWRPADPPKCVPVFCPEPMDINHGSIFQESLDGVMNDFGSVVTYTCDEFYMRKGPASRECMADGRWEGDEPTCYQVSCSPFDPFLHGTVTYGDEEIAFSTAALFTCDDDAVMTPQVDFAICLQDGKWDTYPKCLKKLNVKPGDNQRIQFLNKWNWWSSIRNNKWIDSSGRIQVSCYANYELYNGVYLDTPTIICENDNGKWKPPFPECRGERCIVPEFEHGHFEDKNNDIASGKVEHGDVLETVCDGKYEVEPRTSGSITCDKGRIRKPKCVEKRCKLPQKATDVVTYKVSYRVYGHQFIKHRQRVAVTCKNNGHELAVRNANNKSLKYPAKFSSTCRYGNLDPRQFPTCEEKRCDLQQFEDKSYSKVSGEKGTRINTNKIQSQAVAVLSCSNGYHFSDKSTKRQFRCNKGNFIGATECNPVPCSRPDVKNAKPENDRNQYPHNSQISVKCNKGYEFHDEMEKKPVTCKLGNWTRIPSECVEKKCQISQIQGLQNVYVDNEEGERYEEHQKVESRSSVSLRCRENYESTEVQPLEITCSKGEWFGSLVCNAKACTKPDVTNIKDTWQMESFQHNSEVTVKCKPGYAFPSGKEQKEVTCNFGKWKNLPFGCSEKQCRISHIQGNGVIVDDGDEKVYTEQEIVESGSTVYQRCKEKFESGKPEPVEVTCSKGEWSGSFRCREKACPKPDVKNASIDDKRKNLPHESKVTVQCKTGFEFPNGDEQKDISCDYGVWENKPYDCSAKKCKISTILKKKSSYVSTKKNGNENNPNTVESGAVLQLRCRDGYESKTKGPFNMTCVEGKWRGPLCTQSGCNLPQIANATIYRTSDDEGLNPKDSVGHGEEITVRCDDGFEWTSGEEDKSTRCEGGKWIEELKDKCEAKKCLLSNMTNTRRLEKRTKSGAVLSDKTVVSSGTAVQLSCKSGFEAQNDVKESVCVRGDWSEALICDSSNCTVPEVHNAWIYDMSSMKLLETGDQVPRGENMFIACKNNYVINKSPYTKTHIKIKCKDGIWKKEIPDQCLKPDDCEFIPPEHGEVRVSYTVEDNSRKSEIKVECDTDFEIVHSNFPLPMFKTQCSDGKLVRTMPVCKRIKDRTNINCKIPSRDIYTVGIGRADKAEDGRYAKHKAKIDVSCRKDLQDVRTQCLDGTFEPSIPACEDKKSNDCQIPNEAKYRFDDDNLSPGDKISHGQLIGVECTEAIWDYYNYYDTHQSNMSVLCHNGILYGMDNMQCEDVFSDECRNSVDHGTVVKRFDQIKVECDKGYTLSVSKRNNDFKCNDDGKLINKVQSNQQAKCLPDNCKLPDDLKMQVERWPKGSTTRYLSGGLTVNHLDMILLNCTDVGYEPSNRIVECRAGEWIDEEDDWNITSDTFSKCRAAECEPRCENFGKCVRNNKCQCLREHTGDRCSEFRCPRCKKNGGTCPNSPKCVCPNDRVGVDCEYFNCPLCERNGGTCPNSLKCVCPQDKTGENCEHFKCPECKNNGGTCPTSLKCVCPTGRVGENCEHSGCRPPDTTAVVENKQSMYKVGDEVELGCEPGKRLEGDLRFVCRDSGDWKGHASCVEKKKIKYRFRVTTGDEGGVFDKAGTRGNVFVKMYGETGQQTEEIQFRYNINREWKKLEPGYIETFEVAMSDIGNISQIEIRLEGKYVLPDLWYLEWITIYDPTQSKFYSFPCRKWVPDDKSVHTFKPNGGLVDRQCGDTFTPFNRMSNVRKMTFLGAGRDEIACKMMCIEAEFACYAIVYFPDLYNPQCYGLTGARFHATKPSLNGGGHNVSTRKNCDTREK